MGGQGSRRRSLIFALTGYLEFVVLFGILFQQILLIKPSAIKGVSSILGCLYFSAVTITTLGYGDVQPVSRLARLGAGLESLIGVVFVVTVVASFLGGSPEE
jgi:hypothetical protein